MSIAEKNNKTMLGLLNKHENSKKTFAERNNILMLELLTEHETLKNLLLINDCFNHLLAISSNDILRISTCYNMFKDYYDYMITLYRKGDCTRDDYLQYCKFLGIIKQKLHTYIKDIDVYHVFDMNAWFVSKKNAEKTKLYFSVEKATIECLSYLKE